jgi:ABC-type glutathione transport system ATPase component
MVDDGWPWEHVEPGEENAPTHVRAALMGQSVVVPLRDDGSLALGTWQGIFFCEFDGPRERGPRRRAAVIEVEGLTKRFGSTLAVDDLSFSVEPGRITGFLGPHGAGKSTTMRAILGLVRPTAGSTAVLGRQYRELEDPVRRVGVLLETFDAHPGRSGRNHLRVLALAGGIHGARVDEVLALVDLREAGGDV